MKKIMLFSALAAISLGASAQAVETPGFWDNWSIGVDAGVTTIGTSKVSDLVDYTRPLFGVHFGKQVTPVFSTGAEFLMGINTSRWPHRGYSATVIDNSYLGLWGKVDLINLFKGYECRVRPFDVGVVAGMGWGHDYMNDAKSKPAGYMPYGQNHVTAKFGFDFNFNLSEKVSLGLKPFVLWNLSNGGQALKFNRAETSANLLASLTYHIGGHKFACVNPYNQEEVDALNGQINDLRAQLAKANSLVAQQENRANALATELEECQNRPATVEVVKETSVIENNYLNSVRFVFFKIGSSAVANDQVPNVEMIADFMKHHPNSTVVIKGYASKDGNPESNIRLAQKRAESVKNMLINRFKISASRITAEGEGIGEMFEEESWNRVAICTIED